MRQAFIGCAITIGTLFVAVGSASADNGQHLGQNGQECAATYGFTTLGSAFHAVVQDNGNNAGGVPADLITYC